MIRKKALKIQERLGMRVGVAYGTSKTPVVKTIKQATDSIEALYEVGLKAFVLPGQMFSNITNLQDLYKEHYGPLLNIRNLAQKSTGKLAYPPFAKTTSGTMRKKFHKASQMPNAVRKISKKFLIEKYLRHFPVVIFIAVAPSRSIRSYPNSSGLI